MEERTKQQQHSEKKKTRKLKIDSIHSLKGKIALMLTVAPALLTISMAFISLNLYVTNSRSEHLRMAWGAARLTARAINGDMVNQYIEKGREADGYKETESHI